MLGTLNLEAVFAFKSRERLIFIAQSGHQTAPVIGNKLECLLWFVECRRRQAWAGFTTFRHRIWSSLRLGGYVSVAERLQSSLCEVLSCAARI